jgi:hypothetical protein
MLSTCNPLFLMVGQDRIELSTLGPMLYRLSYRPRNIGIYGVQP